MTQRGSAVRQLSGERFDHAVRQALDSTAVEWVESLDVEDAADVVKSVLLVDDDLWVLRSLSRALETTGLRVLTAPGSEEAMALLSDPEVRVDLLVLDVMMPGLSGLTVAPRASSLRPGMGILFISGRVILPEGDPHPEVTGPTRFLRKPLETDLFFKTVNELLDTPAPPQRRS